MTNRTKSSIGLQLICSIILISLSLLLSSCSKKTETVSKNTVTVDYERLTQILDSVHSEDQKYRIQLDSIGNEFGWNSEEVMKHWKLISQKDSMNVVIVTEIINEHGWLSKDAVGEKGNMTLFLVIQHAGLETQLEFLPVLRKAVQDGNAEAKNLALLEDRTALRQGNLQIYGSQIYTHPQTMELYVAPLLDPENVDQRRAEVGLENMSTYLKQFQLDWDVDEYQKSLPEYKMFLGITEKD